MGAAISARHCGMHGEHVWIPTALNTHKERWGKPLSAFSLSFRHHLSNCPHHSLQMPLFCATVFKCFFFQIGNVKELHLKKKKTTKQKKGKTNNVRIIKKKNKWHFYGFSQQKTLITESVQHTTVTDLTDRNFTPLQIMIRSDMMTDVCSC